MLDAKLVVIHSGLDVVRVRLRTKDRDLDAAVHVCFTNHIWSSPQQTWLAERMPAVCCVAASEDHFLDWIDTVVEALSTLQKTAGI